MGPNDFLNEEEKEKREQALQESLQANRADWHLVNTKITKGMFKCRYCKSEYTTYYQQQTRSSDEPMTTFIKCISCGKSSKE